MNLKSSLHLKCILILLCIQMIFTVNVFAQSKNTINGVVTDAETGETLIGVSVVAKGASTGTLTDLDGRYSLAVAEGTILEFSYVGYLTQDIKATGEIINIALKASQEMLDEVVIVGYGVQKKSVVTAAISRVKGDQLGAVMPTRIDNVLKGMVSGVSITQSSGQPGAESKVRIRGIGTVNKSEPLYIIDGMAVDGGIDYLNPADIESVEVLKDAASAAVYGTRGANGVILVTTKSGKSGKAVINYNFSYGWQNPARKRSVLNAEQYATLMNEKALNDGKSPIYSDPSSYGKGTDWQDEVFNYNAPVQEHQLSVSGGSDKGNYYLSFGSFNQEGIVGGNFDRSNYDRKSLRFNNNYEFFNHKNERNFLTTLKFGSSIAYTRIKNKGIETNSEWGSPLGSALALSPQLTVYDQNPEQTLKDIPTAVRDRNGNVYSIAGSEYNEITNPLASLSLPGDQSNSDKIVAGLWGELELYENLKFKTSYSVDLAFWGKDGYGIPYYLSQTNSRTQSSVFSEMHRGFTWQIENTLFYTKKFDKHDFTLLLGQSARKNRQRDLRGGSFNLKDFSRPHIDGSQVGSKEREASGKMTQLQTLASYFGRLSYNFDERYMAEFTLRRDGSSKFGPDNKWANFPSVSVGWNITNEPFMNNRPEFLSTLKLRGSWGRNGNQNIDDNVYHRVMVGGNDYILGTEGSMVLAPGAKPNRYPNAGVRWEESEQTNIGLDSYLFNGALTFSFDWYEKRTIGMLMDIPLPAYVGDTPPLANVGTMNNSGIELDISYQFKVSDINFRVGANATYLKNKLTKLGNDTGYQDKDSAQLIGTFSRFQNGYPTPYFYGLKTDGLFQTLDEVNSYVNDKGELIQPKAQPGDVRFVDVNGDGLIDEEDRTNIGKGMPDWTLGFNFAVEWKGIDLSMQLHSVVGADIFDASRRIDIQHMNLPEYMLDRWVGPGTSNKIPRLTDNQDNGNWKSSDLYIKNGKFLRLRNLQLGYSLPRTLLSKAFISNLRFYVNAENLLTFTSYKGFDPEISSGGTSLGIDKGVYPIPRTISIGANITF